MSTIKKLSLSTRLERLRTGYPAHDEYVPCAIRSFAATPMSAYFAGFHTEKERLAELLRRDNIDTIPYKDIAYMIYNMYSDKNNQEKYNEAALLLAAPIVHFWRTRKDRNEKT